MSRPGSVTAVAPSRSARRRVCATRSFSPFRHLVIARRLDIERDPARLQPVGGAPRIADQAGRARMLVDADQDALARRPRPGDGMGLHVGQHLVVDPLRGAAQRQLAQRRQVAFGEIMVERALRHFRHIDLAFGQALDQVLGREVDQLDLVGLVDHVVGQRLAHPDRGDLRHHVVQALDVLDVERRIDVDAGGQQLLDVLVALLVPAAGRVGVRQLVHQHQPGLARQDGVDVHLVQRALAVRHLLARHDLEAVEQRLGLGALVGLDDADDDVDAFLAPRAARRSASRRSCRRPAPRRGRPSAARDSPPPRQAAPPATDAWDRGRWLGSLASGGAN